MTKKTVNNLSTIAILGQSQKRKGRAKKKRPKNYTKKPKIGQGKG